MCCISLWQLCSSSLARLCKPSSLGPSSNSCNSFISCEHTTVYTNMQDGKGVYYSSLDIPLTVIPCLLESTGKFSLLPLPPAFVSSSPLDPTRTCAGTAGGHALFLHCQLQGCWLYFGGHDTHLRRKKGGVSGLLSVLGQTGGGMVSLRTRLMVHTGMTSK